MIDFDAIDKALTATCDHYERSAPTVSAWADDLCVRLSQKPESILLVEVTFLARLRESGQWMHPNYAANALYHLMHRLGRDTTGHAGF